MRSHRYPARRATLPIGQRLLLPPRFRRNHDVGGLRRSAYARRSRAGLLREPEDNQPQPAGRERSEQPTAAKAKAPTDETRKENGAQDTKPDRRGFEERSVEELRDRARELEIEGRGSMSKDELIAALRQHAK
jgi:hypothetical protein